MNIRKLDLGRSNRALNAVEARIRCLIKTAQTSEEKDTPWMKLLNYLQSKPILVPFLRMKLNSLDMEQNERQKLLDSIAKYGLFKVVDEEVLNSMVDALYKNNQLKDKFVKAVRASDSLPEGAKTALLDALEWRLNQMRQQQNRTQPAQQDMLQPGPSQPQPAQDVEKRLQLMMRGFDTDFYYDPVGSCYWLRYRNGLWIGFVPAVPDSSRRLTVVEDSKHVTTYRDNATGHHWVQLPNDQWYIVSIPMRQPSYTQFDPQKALGPLPGAKSTQPNIQQPVLTQPK